MTAVLRTLTRVDAASSEAPRPETFPRRALLLAATAKMPYRVAQCLTASGVETHAIGSGIGRGLRFSRRFASFVESRTPVDGTAPPALAAEINLAIERHAIDVVAPGDAQATRSLIGLRERLAAPCLPMPDLPTFDRLNDKWRFFDLCQALGVLTPATTLFATREDLCRALTSGELTGPKIAKPLSQTGSEGCVPFNCENAFDRMPAINYEPILVQDFIDGEDIGASALCERGAIRAFIAHV